MFLHFPIISYKFPIETLFRLWGKIIFLIVSLDFFLNVSLKITRVTSLAEHFPVGGAKALNFQPLIFECLYVYSYVCMHLYVWFCFAS